MIRFQKTDKRKPDDRVASQLLNGESEHVHKTTVTVESIDRSRTEGHL